MATWLLWILAAFGLVSWLLWIGGGATEASSWEFFSWIAGPPTAIFVALCAFTVFVFKAVRASREKDSTPWPQQKVNWNWALVCLLGSCVLIAGVALGGAGQHWAPQLKESRADQIGAAENGTDDPRDTEPPVEETTEDATEDEGDEGPDQRSGEDPPEDDSTSPSPSAEPVSASDQESLLELPMSSGHRQATGTVRVAGDTYTESTRLKECLQCSMEYDLGRDWTTFEAVIGLTDDSVEGSQITFRMYADSRVVLTHTLSRGETEEISVDVEGALHLKLEAERVGSARGVAVWADPVVLR